MEQVFAVLPVKAFRSAKSRLAEFLSPAERSALAESLFSRAILALKGVLPPGHIAVVSRDERALHVAAAMGVYGLVQHSCGLNPAAQEGRNWAMEAGAEALLVLLADLPFVNGAAIERMLSLSSGTREAIVAPGQRGGTHAVLLRPPDVLEFCFGKESFRRYQERARQSQVNFVICDDPALAFDVDLPDDWERLGRSLGKI